MCVWLVNTQMVLQSPSIKSISSHAPVTCTDTYKLQLVIVVSTCLFVFRFGVGGGLFPWPEKPQPTAQ